MFAAINLGRYIAENFDEDDAARKHRRKKWYQMRDPQNTIADAIPTPEGRHDSADFYLRRVLCALSIAREMERRLARDAARPKPPETLAV